MQEAKIRNMMNGKEYNWASPPPARNAKLQLLWPEVSADICKSLKPICQRGNTFILLRVLDRFFMIQSLAESMNIIGRLRHLQETPNYNSYDQRYLQVT